MGTVTASGVGSGIDIDSLVTRLLEAEAAPKTQALDLRETKLQTKLSAYGAFRSAAEGLRTALKSLSDLSKFQARTVAVGDDAILSAAADTSSVPGTYAVEVIDLAQAHKLRSADGAFAATTDVVGTGTLTLSLGGSSVNIVINDSNKTLAGIRDAINNASGNPGVSAAIVTGSNGPQLVLTSTQTGAANTVRVRQTGGDGGLSKLVYDPGVSTQMVEVTAAQDAKIKVDGIEAVNSSNTFENVITGVEITAQAATATGVSTTLSIGYDREASKKAVEDAVKAYNTLRSALTALGKYDAATKSGGPLLGDSTLRDFATALRNEVGKPLSGQSTFGMLFDVGVGYALDGSLTVDATRLQAALSSGFDDVGKAFADTTTGFAVRLDALLDSYLDSGGLLDARTQGLQDSIKDITESREKLAERLTLVEARLRKQFGAMDALVAQLRNTGNYLTSQLATIKTG